MFDKIFGYRPTTGLKIFDGTEKIKPKAKRIIENNFKVTGGNTSLPEARIICLPSTDHSAYEHIVLTEFLINNISRTNSLFLQEGIPAGEFIDKKKLLFYEKINKKVTLMGWDNPAVYNKGIRSTMKLAESMKNKNSSLTFITALYILFIYYPKRLFNRIKRNASLLLTIKKENEENRFGQIFVEAGLNHFRYNFPLKKYLRNTQYIELTCTFPVEASFEGVLDYYTKDKFDLDLYRKKLLK